MNKYPKTVEELPAGSFYAIMKPESVTIPGDERSRTNPGHGYPEHSVDYWSIETFGSREEWQKEIERLSKETGYVRTKFKAVTITPAKVTTNIVVEVE